MWIKICANTNAADAQLAAELGADAVGFVFAPSKRQVTVEQVAAITPLLPDAVEKVGVFAAAGAAEIASAVRDCGLTAVQLHFAYDRELVLALNAAFEGHARLIQVVSLDGSKPGRDAEERLQEAFCDPALYAVLLDAASAGVSGGLGMPFPWRAFAPRLQRVRATADTLRTAEGLVPRVIVAGGLNAGNVRQAMATLQPDGVDVASGVEAEPGRKSPEKLRAFLQAVRSS